MMRRSTRFKIGLAGLVISVGTMLAFLGSLRWFLGYDAHSYSVGISNGVCSVRLHPVEGNLGQGWLLGDSRGSDIIWRPVLVRNGVTIVQSAGSVSTPKKSGIISLIIPLWIPFLLLVVPAIILWRRNIPFGSGYCEECGYDLRGAVSEVCTECGAPNKNRSPDDSTI